MALLRNHRGLVLTDANGRELTTGCTIDDAMFGAGIATGKEVKWSVPDGFEVAGEPAALDSTLVGKHVYMRWETYGWQLGKITAVVTKDTPRLFKSFNFRCIWADGSKGPAKFGVDNYAYGPDARLNSWVILEPAS